MHRDDAARSRVEPLVTAGVDVGRGAVKVAVLAHGRAGAARVLASEIVQVAKGGREGGDAQLAVREGWWRSLRTAGLVPADIALVASTGHGRAVLAHVGHFYRGMSLAVGVRFLFAQAGAVLDIGARQLRCTRFETPVRGRGYAATPRGECWGGDLLAAIPRTKTVAVAEALRISAYEGLAARASGLVTELAVDGPTAITGAMARDARFLAILARRLTDDRSGAVLLSSPEAVFAGAYGAALLAARRFRRATGSQRPGRVPLTLPLPPGRQILN
jgi:benzoyl-CoA reductase subunit D